MEIIGPDWASIDKNNTPNLSAAKNAGARFAIMRAVYGRGGARGGGWLDPVWARDSDRVAALQVKRGAYLFLCFPQHDANVHTPDPEAQADAFAGYVQLISYHDLVPFVDVEEQSSLDAADYFKWIVRCVNRLKDHYGAMPGIYTSARVWNEYVDDHAMDELSDCPPWIAKPWPIAEEQPIDLSGAPGSQPLVPAEFGPNNWWLYQYQGDATRWPGFNSTVDASRFHITAQGATGAHVAWAQRRLGITVTSAFDAATKAAVVDLQLRYGLTQDGVIGPDTFAALAWHV